MVSLVPRLGTGLPPGHLNATQPDGGLLPWSLGPGSAVHQRQGKGGQAGLEGLRGGDQEGKSS